MSAHIIKSGFARRQLFLVPAAIFFAVTSALAQEVTATLSGVVTDASGGAVAGATVTAVEVDTQNKRAASTGPGGNYSIPLLHPGKYQLTVKMAGFKTYQQSDIQLEVNQHANIDVKLEVGEASQRVEVSEAAPTIQTEKSSVGLVVNSTTIVNTPLNGRLTITGLLALAPGIQNAGSQDQIPIYGITPSLNGASPYGGIQFSIDGMTNTMPYLQRGFGEYPPLDGIREFKTITTGADAEFGQPNQVVVITKSGTNEFHGTALEFNRNRFLAAKNFFATSLPTPKYNRNEFGGNFSGPVWIPKLYNGKNRTFFFFNYEGFERRQASTVTSQVPTAAERQGDFSGLTPLVDPLTGAAFPNNIIPANRLNPVTQKLQSILFPLPNLAGTGSNLVENIPLKEEAKHFSLRMDHNISEKDQISGSFLGGLMGPNASIGATSLFGGMAQIGEHNYNTNLSWTHIFSPSLVAETRVGYMHVRIYRTPQNYQNDFASIIPGLGPQDIEGAPQLTIKNITSVAEQGSRDLDQTIQLTHNVTKILGGHTIKAGVGFLRSVHWNDAAQTPQRGSYNFTGQYSGIGYADFVLGYPASTQLPVPSAFQVKYPQNQYQFYIQDDWKITPSLTLNFGVRYDLQWLAQNAEGETAMYVPAQNKIVVFAKTFPNGTIPALAAAFPTVLASQAGLPDNIWDYLGRDTNNLAPRIGLAYKLAPRTVLRSAFGVFYSTIPTLDTGNPISTSLPFGTAETFEQPTGSVPAFTMSNPFPGSGSIPANPVASVENSPVAPYTLQWNTAIEQELPKQIAFRIGYVGQRNLKENYYHGSGTLYPDLNAVVPAPGAVQPRRPIQPYSNIYLYDAPIFQSTMHSLQLGVHKRFSGGLLINAEYQYVRVIGTENFVNYFNWNDSRGNLSGIRPQVLQVSYSYELPIGKGKALWGDVTGFKDKLLSGWVVSGISSFTSGSPFSVTYTTSVQGAVNSRANVVPGASLYPSNQTIRQWFNTAAFTAPANFTYGNSAYNMLWGPGSQNWDASLAKNTSLGERMSLQLRLDAFSVFNHPQFSNPNSSISNATTFGTITSASGSRTVQIGAKFQF